MQLIRSSHNPLISPDPHSNWESIATFNGTVAKKDNSYVMLYRAMNKDNRSVIGKTESPDGYQFSNRAPFIVPENIWEKYGCEDPRITKVGNQYLIFYTALSDFPPTYRGIKVAVALSDDLKTIREKHLVTPFNAKAMTIFPERVGGMYMVFFTVNTDRPPAYIVYAKVKELSDLWDPTYWNDWYKNLSHHIMPFTRIATDGVEIGAPPVLTDHGWVMIYSYIKHYHNPKVPKIFRIEALLLDKEDPTKIIGRIEEPLLIPEASYEKHGIVQDIVFPSGALIEKEAHKVRVYYGGADTTCAVAEQSYTTFMQSFEINAPVQIKCDRFPNNPLLKPIQTNEWENGGVFNPAVVEVDGKVYILYRASSKKNVSHIGLAISHDGWLIDERFSEPVYPLRSESEIPYKKGEAGGCEDPRLTRIGDNIYMLYTAYDGRLARLALTSIPVRSFVNRKWNDWAFPQIISPPGIMDKDGMLFPEKVNGRYVIFHRIEPNICIDYVESLQFKPGQYLTNKNTITPHRQSWDAVKIGINTPPLKTDKGWVVFYHGISHIDGYYRLGALLLDLFDVTKVISWTKYPILEPVTPEEKIGTVNNVVFPCGYVQKKDMIHLYYGGADTVVCGATISLSKLLSHLERSKTKQYLSLV